MGIMGKIKARFLIPSPNLGEGRVRYVFLFLFVFTLFLSPLIYLQTKRPNEVQAGWWNDHFQYRQRLPISNASGVTKTDFQFKLELDTSTLIAEEKLQSDCSDIRFTNISGNELAYWLEPNTCDSANTVVFVKVPSIPTSGADIYWYYGNPSLSSPARTSVDVARDVFVTVIDGVVGAWDMDEASWNGTAGEVIDRSGNEKHGTVTGGASTTQGIFNNAGIFNRNLSQYVTFPNANPSNGYSVSLWFYLNSTINQDIYGDETSFKGMGFQVYSGFFNTFASPGTPPAERWSVGVAPVAAKWYQVVHVFETNSIKTYLDGELVHDRTTTTLGQQNILDFRLGRGSNGSFHAGHLDGLAEGLRMYSFPLDAQQISELYGTGGDRQGYVTPNLPGMELVREYDDLITLGSPAAAELAPGPIAHWSFDSLEGGTFKDLSNNGYHMQNAGSAPQIQGIKGNAANIIPATNYVMTVNTNIKPPTQITFGAWIRPVNMSSNGDIIGFNSGAYTLQLQSSGRLGFRARNSNGNYPSFVTSDIAFSSSDLNKWNYVSATYNGTSVSFYKNGLLISSAPHVQGTYINTLGRIMIGYAAVQYFNGQIDEAKVFPYIRSAEEIRMDYLAGAASAGSGAVLGVGDQSFLSEGLVGYWKMDETSWNGTAGEVKDASGNGNHGTRYGDATTGAGKFGSGGSFDGVDDYVSKTNFQVPPSHTVSYWVKPQNNATPLFSFNSWHYETSLNSSNTLRYATHNGTNYEYCIGNTVITQGAWTMITISYDYNSQVKKIFINGIFDIECKQRSLIAGTTTTLLFARAPGYSNFIGNIDEFRIYNRALSPAEVRALYEWAPGPVGHWKFDEGSGTTAIDSSGNGNNGTITSVTWNGGKHGNSLLFDGNDDYVNVGLGQSLKGIRQAITMSSWIHPSAYKSGSFGPTLISNTNNGGYALRLNNGYLRIELRGVLNSMVLNSDQIPLDTWSYVSATYDGSKVIVYLNGVEIGRQNATGLIDNITNSTVCTFIGAEPEFNCGKTPNGDQFHFPGRIDDVKIYNYARTPEQIKEDMMAGRPLDHASVENPTPTKQTISFSTGNEREDVIDGPGADPIAYWDFNERTGTTLTDKSGNENHGTLVNGPEWVSGKYGAGLRFDGVNDGVSVGNINLTTSNRITVTFWLNWDEYINNDDLALESSTNFNSNNGAIIINPNPSSNGSGKFAAGIYQGGYRFETIERPSARAFHHFSIIFDNSTTNGDIKFFVNGVEQVSNLVINSKTSSGNFGNYSWYLMSRAGSGLFGKGVLDEVKIFDYALTPAQVAYEYNRGAPIAHWMMDECQGSTIHDASGNENHGTLTIGPSGTQTTVGTCDTAGSAWANGKVGRLNSSMSFDGVDDYVLKTTFNTSTVNQLSVGAWIKTNTTSTSMITQGSAGIGFGIFVNRFTSGKVLAFFDSSSGTNSAVDESSTSVNDNNWHHVMATNDGSTTKIFIDGRLENSYSEVLSKGSGNIYFGSNAGSSQFFNGQIDDVRIYNYALSADQVKTLYNNGAVSFR